jgi:cytochrome P450
LLTTRDPTVSDEEYSREAIEDPYEFYGRMREQDPIHWNAKYELWDVTGYEDVAWVARNNEILSSNFPKYDTKNRHAAIAAEDEHLYAVYRDHSARQLIRKDRPEHLEMRMVIHKYFTPKRVDEWRPLVRDSVRQLLDEADQRAGRLDILHDLAEALPVMVITALLGVPYEMRGFIRELTPKLIPNAGDDPYRMRGFVSALHEMNRYVEPLIEQRLREPTGDLLSVLAEGERSGVFTRADCIANAHLLLVAGHETTINLIANAVLDMIQNVDQWELLRSDPDGRAWHAAEECLRYEAPVKHFDRIALADVEVKGKTIRKGDRVRYVMSSANRDPRKFVAPDRMDLTRHPNPHLTFGNGIHHCLGASLARLEGEEVLRGLAERYSTIKLGIDEPVYKTDFIFRALNELPVHLN